MRLPGVRCWYLNVPLKHAVAGSIPAPAAWSGSWLRSSHDRINGHESERVCFNEWLNPLDRESVGLRHMHQLRQT